MGDMGDHCGRETTFEPLTATNIRAGTARSRNTMWSLLPASEQILPSIEAP
jgi:hypothetical protein